MWMTHVGRNVYPLKNSKHRSYFLSVLNDLGGVLRVLKYVVNPYFVLCGERFQNLSGDGKKMNAHAMIPHPSPFGIRTGIDYTAISKIDAP